MNLARHWQDEKANTVPEEGAFWVDVYHQTPNLPIVSVGKTKENWMLCIANAYFMCSIVKNLSNGNTKVKIRPSHNADKIENFDKNVQQHHDGKKTMEKIVSSSDVKCETTWYEFSDADGSHLSMLVIFYFNNKHIRVKIGKEKDLWDGEFLYDINGNLISSNTGCRASPVVASVGENPGDFSDRRKNSYTNRYRDLACRRRRIRGGG